ncbi:DUF523 domain-containing protein [Pseudoalteromonas sp. T1lg65]|uniref:DUF523 domain-containing protein n=1 Tax=Pseudoalteromonas sp. T1lg65 TaxID=2077101 RepID=UPI003F7977E4
MYRVLVSSCLLGKPVRYDGTSQQLTHHVIQYWQSKGWLLSLCPEMSGGLPTPRPPAEIHGKQVLTQSGEDFTEAFQRGAEVALSLCRRHNIQFALLKESSPSCGRNWIYDGVHSGRKISGMGITAKLLVDNGISVFSEEQLPALTNALATAD